MDVIVDRCAGLDVHKKTVMAAVRDARTGRRPRAEDGARVRDVHDESAWICGTGWLAEGVTQVAMEATGVYWKPVWHVLEGTTGSSCCWSTRRTSRTCRAARPT